MENVGSNLGIAFAGKLTIHIMDEDISDAMNLDMGCENRPFNVINRKKRPRYFEEKGGSVGQVASVGVDGRQYAGQNLLTAKPVEQISRAL